MLKSDFWHIKKVRLLREKITKTITTKTSNRSRKRKANIIIGRIKRQVKCLREIRT